MSSILWKIVFHAHYYETPRKQSKTQKKRNWVSWWVFCLHCLREKYHSSLISCTRPTDSWQDIVGKVLFSYKVCQNCEEFAVLKTLFQVSAFTTTDSLTAYFIGGTSSCLWNGVWWILSHLAKFREFSPASFLKANLKTHS